VEEIQKALASQPGITKTVDGGCGRVCTQLSQLRVVCIGAYSSFMRQKPPPNSLCPHQRLGNEPPPSPSPGPVATWAPTRDCQMALVELPWLTSEFLTRRKKNTASESLTNSESSQKASHSSFARSHRATHRQRFLGRWLAIETLE
jgi:hypothetical protein